VALLFNLFGIAVSGIAAAILVRWTFGLFLVGVFSVGLLIFSYFIYVFIMRRIDSKRNFEEAQGHAVEAISLIKTIKALRAEKRLQEVYNSRLADYR
jgi:ABC-type bacteriocin/lantibiotic exporter with double-glycine peptidase domain